MVKIYYFVEDIAEDRLNKLESMTFDNEKEADEFCYNYEIEVLYYEINLVRIYYFVEDIAEDRLNKLESMTFDNTIEADEFCYNEDIEAVHVEIV